MSLFNTLDLFIVAHTIWLRVETGLGHPGCLGHALSRSSESDSVYKTSGLCIGSHVLIILSDPNKVMN